MLKSIEIILQKRLFDFSSNFQNVPKCVPPQSSSIFWELICVPPRLTSIFWDLVFSQIDQIALKIKKVRTTPFDEYFLGVDQKVR